MSLSTKAIKLSRPGKMPCYTWSLQAIDTCPGSKDSSGALVDACATCYAREGNYNFPNVRDVREFNRRAWRQDAFIPDMTQALRRQDYFRWFDSGDMYHLDLAWKIYQIMRATPWCRHWLPTRMYKFKKFADVLQAMEALPNVVVRRSSDSIQGGRIPGRHTSTIIPDAAQAPAGVHVCPSSTQAGKCLECRACWNDDVPVVAYIAHGQRMTRAQNIIARG